MIAHQANPRDAAAHHCIPRPAQRCPACGEILPSPEFCTVCGEDISPLHTCAPTPLPHHCPPEPAGGRCLSCGELLPARHFCSTCGQEITPAHHCKAMGSPILPRPEPVHTCPSLPLDYCQTCGALKPALRFCEQCGMDITARHVCQPKTEPHHCPPHLLMPRRCAHCGEIMSEPRHCGQCGADITPAHACAS